jgi:hypothetical protein
MTRSPVFRLRSRIVETTAGGASMGRQDSGGKSGLSSSAKRQTRRQGLPTVLGPPRRKGRTAGPSVQGHRDARSPCSREGHRRVRRGSAARAGVPGRVTASRLVSGLQGATGSTVGPGGDLYVTEALTGTISRVDPKTGEIETFARARPRRGRRSRHVPACVVGCTIHHLRRSREVDRVGSGGVTQGRNGGERPDQEQDQEWNIVIRRCS